MTPRHPTLSGSAWYAAHKAAIRAFFRHLRQDRPDAAAMMLRKAVDFLARAQAASP